VKTSRYYSPTQKREAVNYYKKNTNLSMRQCAKDCNVGYDAFQIWCKKAGCIREYKTVCVDRHWDEIDPLLSIMEQTQIHKLYPDVSLHNLWYRKKKLGIKKGRVAPRHRRCNIVEDPGGPIVKSWKRSKKLSEYILELREVKIRNRIDSICAGG